MGCLVLVLLTDSQLQGSAPTVTSWLPSGWKAMDLKAVLAARLARRLPVLRSHRMQLPSVHALAHSARLLVSRSTMQLMAPCRQPHIKGAVSCWFVLSVWWQCLLVLRSHRMQLPSVHALAHSAPLLVSQHDAADGALQGLRGQVKAGVTSLHLISQPAEQEDATAICRDSAVPCCSPG